MNPESLHQESINFLSEAIHVEIEISKEAFEHFPEVDRKDIASQTERFRVLLGDWQIVDFNKVRVAVKYTIEIPDQAEFYNESNNHILGVNIPSINNLVESLKEACPEFSQLDIVGEIHTHPVVESEGVQNQKSFWPSRGDISSIVQEYIRGNLSQANPYIFVIGGALESGETGYSYFRITKNFDKYSFAQVHEDGFDPKGADGHEWYP